MTETTKTKVKAKINEIKNNIESFMADVNINELKSSLNTIVKDAQADLNKMIDKDLENVKKVLQKEKNDFESKAKKFLDNHKKELATLQTQIDRLVKAGAKLKRIKATASAKKATTTKKQVKKKVAKAQSKPGFKKTTKKSAQ
jgi:DNA anti-recombination protein RmuC